MVLSVAIMGRDLRTLGGQVTPWGFWDSHDWEDPTELALDRYVRHPSTRQVLVLTPPEGHAASAALTAVIAAVRPDIQTRVETTTVSVATLVRALERVPEAATSANLVHAALTSALRETTWGAWMPSVTRLGNPAPTMRQHISSFFGGEGFLAVRGEPGWVAKLPIQQWQPGQRLTRHAASGAGSQYDCHSFGELPEIAIAALFQMGLTVRPQRRDSWGDAAAVWGSEKAIEFVIAPEGAAQVGDPSGTCQVCEDPVWGMTCPFCRIVPTHGLDGRSTITLGGTR